MGETNNVERLRRNDPKGRDSEAESRLSNELVATRREFVTALASRIADEHVKIEEIMLFAPAESSTDTPLYRLLAAKSREHYPGAGVLPAVSTGFTDSHFFREIGIASYGYGPFLLPEATLGSVHGNNERIVIENFHKGVALMREIVAEFAGITLTEE